MTDWTWEYLPDAEHVVGGLDPQVRAEVERLADAAAVKYLGALRRRSPGPPGCLITPRDA
jgi:hypothetical protein